MWLLYAGLLVIVLLGIYCLWKVRQEYEVSGALSVQTAVAVWVLYLLHAGLTGFAAWRSVWMLPMGKSASVATGGALVAFGLGLALAGVIAFRSLRRMSGRETNKLVCSGVYRWSRNPQNVGWGLVLLGIALLGRSAVALFLVVLFWLIFRFYLVVEERYLEQIFGAEWRLYRSRTSRFLGWPKRV